MNLSFCGTAPGNLVGDYLYNWPINQWTARLRVSDRDRYVQTAVYKVNPKNLDNRFTLGYLHGATGVLVPVELGWMPRIGAAQLPGFYKIGAWYSNVKRRRCLSGRQSTTAGPDGRRPAAALRTLWRLDRCRAAGDRHSARWSCSVRHDAVPQPDALTGARRFSTIRLWSARFSMASSRRVRRMCSASASPAPTSTRALPTLSDWPAESPCSSRNPRASCSTNSACRRGSRCARICRSSMTRAADR